MGMKNGNLRQDNLPAVYGFDDRVLGTSYMQCILPYARIVPA